MSRKQSRKAALKQADKAAPARPELPLAQPAAQVATAGWRRWAGRLALMLLGPLFFLGTLELALRLCGYGYPTSFFVKTDDGHHYTANRSFGWRFFPRETSPPPHPFLMPVQKEPGTLRVFILGESAALGTPAPPFGFGRILEVMLREQYPNRRIEVINAPMRGIDSNIILPIARECARHQPDLFIVYMGNNEAIGLYSPEPGSRNLGSRRWLLRAGQRVKSLKLFQLLESIYRKARKPPPRKPQDMEYFRAHYFASDDPGRAITYSNFRENLDEICHAGIHGRTKVLASTVGSNLKDFPPLGSLHRRDLSERDRAAWDTSFAAGTKAESQEQYTNAIQQYLEAARMDDHFAELHFRLARCYFATGQFTNAQEHFALGRDWDALQFRTDRKLNTIIREIVSSRQGQVQLVDAERAFAESALSEHHIPGSALFNDHVHMSFDGDYTLARTMLPAVAAALGLSNSTGSAESAKLPTRAECAERLAFTPWEEVNVAAGMLHSLDNPPFLDQLDHKERQARANQIIQERLKALNQKEEHAKATAIYRAAIARNPSDWQLHFIFGNFLSDTQDYNAAVEEYKYVVSLLPKLQPMRMALGKALLATGRTADALDQFDEILRFDPDYAPAKSAIAQVHAASSPFRRP